VSQRYARLVWRPHSWNEIEALLGRAVETSTLEFKQKMTDNNAELAKDVTSMTQQGGVLMYGIAEDPTTRRATAITPIEIKGTTEHLQQVLGSHVSPVPDVDPEFFESPDDPTKGVLVVAIPPSPLAPHQTGGRYPSRRGTTTDYLTEAEVERAYGQRSEAAGKPLTPAELIEFQFVAIWTELNAPSVGEMRLVIRPRASEARHPSGPWQETHLREAVRRAANRQRHRFNNITMVRSFNALSQWEPHGVAGWASGEEASLGSAHADRQRFGATLAYPARLSFQAHWGLDFADANNQRLYISAREIDIAYELAGMLAIAGEYFMEIEGAGLLVAAMKLKGFQGALSQLGTQTGKLSELPGALDGVNTATETSALELRDTPELAGRRLIENWLPPFYMVGGKKLDQFGKPIDLFDLVVNDAGGAASASRTPSTRFCLTSWPASVRAVTSLPCSP
jgi:hypothetical protein